MITLDRLIQDTFAVPLRDCAYSFTRWDDQGCVGHVGLDFREVEFKGGNRRPVAAIRFVVVRGDQQNRGIASALMKNAHAVALAISSCRRAILFTSVPGFYERIGYRTVRDGAMAFDLRATTITRWPMWEPVGGEW